MISRIVKHAGGQHVSSYVFLKIYWDYDIKIYLGSFGSCSEVVKHELEQL